MLKSKETIQLGSTSYEDRRMVSEVNIPDGAKREPRAEECEWPLEAGIGKEMEFS